MLERAICGLDGKSEVYSMTETEIRKKVKNPDLQVGHNRVGSGVFTL